MKKIGIILIIIGILITIFTGISFKTEEDVVEIGEFAITQEKEHEINWPQWVGGAVALGGIVILLLSRKKQ
ncbi:hypothetical protein [Alkalitalea saponilacus]|uniref:Uncharacterized protein n=1 Tax=Alkalitalea saponilacus TaxID=889453 RepID=A0A1T5BMA1_9BACT|nr:hypothetical protein [Alkalitalea saponilacus]ASB49656.1 hypothetical protein CDL62_11150 [Alkalitalea saponilacus]SKB48265.1 hypothetical protein SAMN03080601_00556 [Alkalitalea saponilacus]